MIKKLPWGIIAGVCAAVLFFTLTGTIAAYIILNAIAGATNATASLFAEWYQVALFVADIVLAAAVIASIVLYAIRVVGEKKGEKSE